MRLNAKAYLLRISKWIPNTLNMLLKYARTGVLNAICVLAWNWSASVYFHSNPIFHCQLSCFAYMLFYVTCNAHTADCFLCLTSRSRSFHAKTEEKNNVPWTVRRYTNWSHHESYRRARAHSFTRKTRTRTMGPNHWRTRNGMFSLSWVVESNAWLLLDALRQSLFVAIFSFLVSPWICFYLFFD